MLENVINNRIGRLCSVFRSPLLQIYVTGSKVRGLDGITIPEIGDNGKIAFQCEAISYELGIWIMWAKEIGEENDCFIVGGSGMDNIGFR
jgi:hypothetical protein